MRLYYREKSLFAITFRMFAKQVETIFQPPEGRFSFTFGTNKLFAGKEIYHRSKKTLKSVSHPKKLFLR